MATMIPAIGTCGSRMTSGERRLAQRLENKLEADYIAKHLKEVHNPVLPGATWPSSSTTTPASEKPYSPPSAKNGVPVTHHSDITLTNTEDTVRFLIMHC